jgi:uncharacterized protein YceH (UPF0502 family)
VAIELEPYPKTIANPKQWAKTWKVDMNIELSAIEARVIGCLMEKEITTPDQYPLSLNALTNACNQKTNRDPVLELAESAVQQAVDSLMKKYLVSDKSAGYGGRVTKYKHRFCNTEFGSLKFSKQEFGIICVLLLRGPQTPGELRSRTSRLCEFADVTAVESALSGLMTREEGPFVARLARAPGARESRYAHCFSGMIESVAEPEPSDDPVARVSASGIAEALSGRVARLEDLVESLREELDRLKLASQKEPVA